MIKTKKIKLNVLIILDVLSERNGVGSFYRDLCEHLKDYISHIEIIGPKRLDDSYTFFSISMPGDATQRLYFPKMFKLANIIKEKSPDVIIFPTPGFYGLVALGKAKKLNISICPVLHNDYDEMAKLYWKGVKAYLVNNIGTFVNKFFFKSSPISLIVNKDMENIAKKLGSKKVEIIGTPLAKIFSDRPLSPINKKINKILFAGRLAPEKGVDKIINAAKDHKNVEFIFAGEGPLKSTIIDYTYQLNNISYLGWLSRSELIDVIDQSQIFVLPSFIETFGTAAFEGMARGRIVIVSGQSGINKWPLLAKNLINMDDFDSLSESIDFVMNMSEKERDTIVKKAYFSAHTLNKENIATWIDILKELSKKTFQSALSNE